GSLKEQPGDLASLSELDEASLLAGLRERFLRQQVYTDIGDILVAMNPFQPLPLYGREVSPRGPRAGRAPLLPQQPFHRYFLPPRRSLSATGTPRP
ncbi:MYO16 protein, partial [Rostratula benghalensis]|nr:MYO16 protein [Rostratula benghalensis]